MTTDLSARKSVIVTGASCGIERSAARRLATDGFAIVVNYPAMPPAEEVVAEIKSGEGQAITRAGCLASAADVEGFFSRKRWTPLVK